MDSADASAPALSKSATASLRPNSTAGLSSFVRCDLVHEDIALEKRLRWGDWEMRNSATSGPAREMVKMASRKTWGPGFEKRRRS